MLDAALVGDRFLHVGIPVLRTLVGGLRSRRKSLTKVVAQEAPMTAKLSTASCAIAVAAMFVGPACGLDKLRVGKSGPPPI